MHLVTHILQHRRRAKGKTEAAYFDLLTQQVAALNPTAQWVDHYGNLFAVVGENTPKVMFSCHTDTVHKTEGINSTLRQSDKGIITTHDGDVLGADNGAGIYICLALIANRTPGVYIFHRDEEIGGLGSSYIARTPDSILDEVVLAIAFDRRGTKEIITHQFGQRCASDAHALWLAEQLGLGHKPSAKGVFTDTANYAHFVPECINVSSGTADEHQPTESLDTVYLDRLIDALCTVDWDSMVVERDPCEDDDTDTYGTTEWVGMAKPRPLSRQALLDLVTELDPAVIVELLYNLDVTDEDIDFAEQPARFF